LKLRKKFAAAVLIVTWFTICASIVTGSNQSLLVKTSVVNGNIISDATCKLINDKRN
jgi:hypothetical protein